MIKINLLENSKGKSKRGGGGPSMPTMEMGDMGSPKLKILAVLVVAGLFNLGAPTGALGTGTVSADAGITSLLLPASLQ